MLYSILLFLSGWTLAILTILFFNHRIHQVNRRQRQEDVDRQTDAFLEELFPPKR